MFAAGILFAAPSVELSIYSTCKRISQKLLRNVNKFFDIMVNHNMATEGFKVIRQNMEEIVLQGPNGVSDVRIVNSYPSKVSLVACMLVLFGLLVQPRLGCKSQHRLVVVNAFLFEVYKTFVSLIGLTNTMEDRAAGSKPVDAAGKKPVDLMPSVARPFSSKGVVSYEQDGVTYHYQDNASGLYELVSAAIWRAREQALDAEKESAKDNTATAKCVATLETTVEQLHDQLQELAVSFNLHFFRQALEQQQKAHQAALTAKDLAHQAEVKMMQQAHQAELKAKDLAHQAALQGKGKEQQEQGNKAKESPAMAAIVIPDVSAETGRVKLNSNVLALHHACGPFVGPIDGEKTDSDDEDVFRPKRQKVERVVDTSSDPPTLRYPVPWGTKVAVPLPGGMVTTQVVGPMKEEKTQPDPKSGTQDDSDSNDAMLNKLAGEVTREITAFWAGFDLFHKQQKSQEERVLRSQGKKITAHKIKKACEQKWNRLEPAERQQWAKGSAERERGNAGNPHPDREDDCMIVEQPAAKSHRENAYEGWMAANGGAAASGAN